MINGLTINQLVKVSEIKGNEILPLSVPLIDPINHTVVFVTRGIRFNDMVAKLKQAIEKNQEDIAYNTERIENQEEITDDLIDKTTYLQFRQNQIQEEVDKNTYNIGYLTNKTDADLEEVKKNISANAYNIAVLDADLTELTSYTHAGFAANDLVDAEQSEDLNEVEETINNPFNQFE